MASGTNINHVSRQCSKLVVKVRGQSRLNAVTAAACIAASRFTCALFYCSSDKAHTACVILAILQVNDLKRPRGQEK